MSQRRSLMCALAAIMLCITMALASAMPLTLAFAEENGVSDPVVATDAAGAEADQGTAGNDTYINNESAAPEGEAGDPSTTPSGEAESIPAGDAAGEGDTPPSTDATSADATANTDGTVTGAASSAAADVTTNPDAGVAPATAGDVDKIADGSTLTAWQDHLTQDGQLSTKNIGRIWTDKTVSAEDITLSGDIQGDPTIKLDEGEDFLVGLSALSSMSEIKTNKVTPLDIVLVLDMSGSMQLPMDDQNYSYVEASSRDVVSTGYYWVQLDDGSYQRVEYYDPGAGWQPRWYYRDASGLHYVNPTGAQQIQGVDNVQFYTVNPDDTRLAALRTAVNGFIDATDAANQNLPASTPKHEISLVQFSTAADSKAVIDLTSESADLKDALSAMAAGGGTRADAGIQAAQNEFDAHGRDGAEKVIIFFTDGQPSTDTGYVFTPSTANKSIELASAMNAQGVTFYSVGVFDGADPNQSQVIEGNSVSQFNAYMNGMSSNYPDAESYTNLGTRVDWTHQYYKAATNSEELNKVFTEIATEIQTESSGSPIEANKGGAYDAAGYLTFTDTLGDYMQLDTVKSIVYANQQYALSDTVDLGNGKTQYIFNYDVDGNETFGKANLNDIIITVTKGASLEAGDVVQVGSRLVSSLCATIRPPSRMTVLSHLSSLRHTRFACFIR